MTAGKRPRLMMRRTVSVASLGGAGSDHPTELHHQQQHQHPVHQVIGFAPKAYSENSKLLLHHDSTPMVYEDSSSPSSSSTRSGKPFSGLSFLSDNRDPPDNKVGLGIALETKDEMQLVPGEPSPPVLHSAGFRSPPPVAPPMNSSTLRYLPPPDHTNMNKSFICFESNSTKYDRCFLRPPLTTLGFLKSCFLCKRDISHGHDIYMYRGDRAFCSAECRHQQILNDERAERKCSSAALKQIGGGGVANHHHHHHHHQHQQPRVHHQRGKVSTTPATTAAAA